MIRAHYRVVDLHETCDEVTVTLAVDVRTLPHPDHLELGDLTISSPPGSTPTFRVGDLLELKLGPA